MFLAYFVYIFLFGSAMLFESIVVMKLGLDARQLLFFGLLPIVYILVIGIYGAPRNRGAKELRVRRTIDRPNIYRGDMTYVEVLVENATSRRFSSMKVMDYYPNTFQLVDGNNIINTSLEPNSVAVFGYVLKAIRRGTYDIGPTNIQVSDDCGYVGENMTVKNESRISVYPTMPAVSRTARRRAERQLIFGTRPSRERGPGFDYASSRKYEPGDELRIIDWNILAKIADLGTKEFHVEKNISVVIVIDCSGTMAEGHDGISKLDRSIEACSYLAYHFLGKRNDVGLLVCEKDRYTFLPPEGSREVGHRIIIRLTDLEAEGKADVNSGLNHMLKHIGQRCVFIIFSDLQRGASILPGVKAARDRKHDVIVVCPFVPFTDGGAARGKGSVELTNALVDILSIEQFETIKRIGDRVKEMGGRFVLASPEKILDRIMEGRR